MNANYVRLIMCVMPCHALTDDMMRCDIWQAVIGIEYGAASEDIARTCHPVSDLGLPGLD